MENDAESNAAARSGMPLRNLLTLAVIIVAVAGLFYLLYPWHGATRTSGTAKSQNSTPHLPYFSEQEANSIFGPGTYYLSPNETGAFLQQRISGINAGYHLNISYYGIRSGDYVNYHGSNSLFELALFSNNSLNLYNGTTRFMAGGIYGKATNLAHGSSGAFRYVVATPKSIPSTSLQYPAMMVGAKSGVFVFIYFSTPFGYSTQAYNSVVASLAAYLNDSSA